LTIANITDAVTAKTRRQAYFLLDHSVDLHCVPKNIPDIFDCNVKKDYRILIIFGTDSPETTCRQVTI